MSISIVIDVALGLSLIFFTLSLIASALQEIIAGLFTWRGTYLAKGIDVILDNSKTASFSWVNFADFLRAHLTSRPGTSAAEILESKLSGEPGKNGKNGKTSERVPDTPENRTLQRVLQVQAHPLMRAAPTNLPSYVPARNFSLALLEVLRDGSSAPLFTQAERTIAALPQGDLRRTLSVYLQDAGGDLDTFHAHLERWFDDAMDRVGGIYRRLTQYVMLGLGVILAVSFNVDTIYVAQRLTHDQNLRDSVAVAAENAAKQTETPAKQTQTPAKQTETPATPPGNNATQSGDNATPQASSSGAGVPSDTLKAQIAQLQSLGLPIGWDLSCDGGQSWLQRHLPCITPASTTNPPPPVPAGPAQNVVLRMLGWLVTAVAVSLGAPFWFDLLQNFVSLRAAGTKPNRADDPRPPGANP
jgi:hypothetical protein